MIYKTLQEMRAVSRGRVGAFELKETKGKNYIALYDLVTSKQRQIINTGNNVYEAVELIPGKHYAIPDAEILERISEKFKQKRKYSDSLRMTLEEAGIPFREVICKTCGGRARHLEYDTVVVVYGSNKTKRQKDDTPEDSKE